MEAEQTDSSMPLVDNGTHGAAHDGERPNSDPRVENSSSWSKPLTHTKPAEKTEDGDLILFELHIRVTDRNKKVPSVKLMEYLDVNSAKTLSSLITKSAVFHQAYFTTLAGRDSLHNKKATINGANVIFEAYPPQNSDHFVPPPKVISTKMRLIALPPHLSLQKVQKAIGEKISSYIADSASFETFSSNRNVRNGNLSFFVRGIKHGLPFQYLRVDGYDVLMQNATHPLDPSFTLKVSSEEEDPVPAKDQDKNTDKPKPKPKVNTTLTSDSTNPRDAIDNIFEASIPDNTEMDVDATKTKPKQSRDIVDDHDDDADGETTAGEVDEGFTKKINRKTKRLAAKKAKINDKDKGKDKDKEKDKQDKVQPVGKKVKKPINAASFSKSGLLTQWLVQQ